MNKLSEEDEPKIIEYNDWNYENFLLPSIKGGTENKMLLIEDIQPKSELLLKIESKSVQVGTTFIITDNLFGYYN
jgi:hypothetical protein